MAYSDQFNEPGVARSGPRSMAADLLDPAVVRDLVIRRARQIAGITLVGFLVLAALIIVIGPRYSSTAVVLVDPRQQRVLSSDVVLSGIGNDMAAVDSQVEVIQSTPIAQKVIGDLHLDQDPEFLPSANPVVDLVRSLIGDRSDDRMQYVLSKFATNLKVRRRGLTYVLEIEFLSRNAEKSARIANAVADAYVAQQTAAKLSATSEASNWLGDRLANLRKQASDAEAAVARYKEENNLVNTGDRRSIVEQQLSDINQQLVLASVRSGEIRARLKQIEKAAATPGARNALVDSLSSPVIAALRAQYATAAKTSAELGQSLGPLHPAIKTSQAELEALSRQIDDEIGRLSQGVRNELEASQTRERALEASLAKLKTQTASNDQSLVRLHELERESEAAQAILQRSLTRYKETKEQEGLQVADVRILSPAAVPLVPNGPNRKLLLALAGFASLVLAIGVSFLGDRGGLAFVKRNGATKPAPPVLPILGYLPDVGLPVQKSRALWPSRGKAPDGAEALSRFSFNSPFSPFSEAIRKLVVDFSAAHPRRPYVIAVAGATERAGTSTIAAAFADALARSGSPTLLIDIAPCAPQPGATTQPLGLLQVAQSSLPVELAIQKSGNAGADLLYSGCEAPEQVTTLLAAPGLVAAFEALQDKFAVIVIDCGMPVATKETRLLITLADSALLVVASSGPAAALPRAVVTAIEPCAEKFDGIVMNKVDLDNYLFQKQPNANAAASQPVLRERAG